MILYHLTALGIPIPGIEVIVDPFMPGPTQIKHAKRGPYFRKREKRLARDPKNWTVPDILVIGQTYFCHPSTFEALKLALHSTA